MGNPELIKVIDFIMNKAAEQDLEVIIQAIQRRQQRKGISKLSDMNFGNMSRNVASRIQNQLSMPVDNMRKMVREMVVKMIKQSAPDIPAEHLDVLLNEWVPEPSQKQAEPSPVPPDILLTMVKHFIEYSTHSMTQGDIQLLQKSLPNWYEEYWNHFPENIKELINHYLNGRMELTDLWNQVKIALRIPD